MSGRGPAVDVRTLIFGGKSAYHEVDGKTARTSCPYFSEHLEKIESGSFNIK